MKKLDVSSITNASQFPVKKGTLQFLQDSYTEIVRSLTQALVGTGYDANVVYILYGSRNAAVLPAYNIPAGAAFYQGEIFLIDAASFTPTGTNVAVFEIVQTQYTTDADPVTFTDGAVRSVHNIRKLQIVQGAPGSGVANYSQAFFLNFNIPAQLNLLAAGGANYPGNVVQIVGAYPNLQLYVPTPPTSVNPILKAGSVNIGDVDGVGGVGSDYAVNFGSPLSTANYYVMGSVISNGANADNDTTTVFTIRARTANGFTVHFKEFASQVQNIAFEYIIFAK